MSRGLLTAVATLVPIALCGPVFAQGVSVDVSAGRTVYQPVSANVDATNIIGALRYEPGQHLWVYGTGGVPLRSGDSSWGAVGVGGRLERPLGTLRRTSLGVDTGVHAYLFRDGIVATRGNGAALDAVPFVSVPAGPGSVELRAGWRGQTLSYFGVRETRDVVEAGIRAVYGATVRTELDAKWVRADEGGYPFVGASVVYGGRPLQLWLRAGKWLDDTLDDVSWGAGVGFAVAPHSSVWSRVWQDAPDPLYWNVPRRSWGIGVTHGFGRRGAGVDRAALWTGVRTDGRVVISLPVSEAPVPYLFVAGDFTGWQPVAMAREGSAWVIRVPLEPGVYHYAFRTGDGRWFVPRSVGSRRDDGMGGHVAVLVVG